MKAPEKLYLSKNIYSTFLYQVPDPDDDSTVEYVRKNAVIEWLKDCSTYKDFNGNTHVDKDLFNTMVEDFKKYMED